MKKLIFALATVVMLGLLGCKDDPPNSTRWDQASSAAASAAAASASAAASAPPTPKTETGAVNKFFPKDQDGLKVVCTVDKPGYAEAKLIADGGELAVVTVGDADAAALAKFDTSKERLGDRPLVTVGKNQTAVLVGSRQVKLSSKTLDPEARKTWISKLDLVGLSSLPPAAASTAAP
ncbi:hypothetical protein BH09MYX1_BH09MYX1_42210 [soil metagenome]